MHKGNLQIGILPVEAAAQVHEPSGLNSFSNLPVYR